MAELFVLPKQVAVQSSGVPHASAKMYFYRTGTTTDQSVYTDVDCSVEHSQPVESSSAGVFPPIYLNPNASYDYRVQLKTSAGVLIYDVDGIPAISLTQAQIARVLYPRTGAEVLAGITPTHYTYPPGYVLRYGGAVDGFSDCTEAMNAALSQAQQEGGDPVVLPVGEILIENALDALTSPVHVQGAGMGLSIIHTVHDIDLFTIGVGASQSLFEGFTITGKGSGATKSGFLLDNSNTNLWRHIEIKDFGYGLKFTRGSNSCYLNAVDNCRICL
jgi:hypothetical protein